MSIKTASLENHHSQNLVGSVLSSGARVNLSFKDSNILAFNNVEVLPESFGPMTRYQGKLYKFSFLSDLESFHQF